MKKLSILGVIKNGAKIPDSSGEYPAFGGNGLIKYVDKYNYPANTIIIGRVGAFCGSVHFSPTKCWVTDNALAFCPKHEPYYVYLLLSIIGLNKYHIGSSQPLITQSIINEIEVSFIENDNVQKKIGSLVFSLDQKIANNNKICAELEAMAKTLYDYWFLQFDFPDEQGRPYKSSGGKMVWNDQLKREIPAGWEVKKINDTCDVIYGFPLKVELFSDEGKPIIRIRDILNNSISGHTYEKVGEEYLTKVGDLLVGMDGNFQMNYWINDGDIVNQRITRIRKKNVPIIVIKNQIAPYVEAKVDVVARSTVGHLSDGDIKNLNIIVPCSHLDLNLFDDVLLKVCKLKKQNQELASLRDFLLPLLMNGQVKVG